MVTSLNADSVLLSDTSISTNLLPISINQQYRHSLSGQIDMVFEISPTAQETQSRVESLVHQITSTLLSGAQPHPPVRFFHILLQTFLFSLPFSNMLLLLPSSSMLLLSFLTCYFSFPSSDMLVLFVSAGSAHAQDSTSLPSGDYLSLYFLRFTASLCISRLPLGANSCNATRALRIF